MTTPEKFRRRQRFEGIVLVLLGVFTVGYVLYDSHEAGIRDQCIADSFHDFSTSLTVRSSLTVRTDQLKIRAERLQDQADVLQDEKITNTAHLIKQVFAAATPQESLAAYFRYQHELNRIQQDSRALDHRQDRLEHRAARVTAKRVKTVIPPFPTGKCGGTPQEKKNDDR